MSASNDFLKVQSVLNEYFDGLYFSDADRLARAFHPQAHYVSVTDGSLTYKSMDEYLPVVRARPSPASRDEPRRDRIVSIEFAGDKTAIARVECSIADKLFSDLLTFIFINGRWQIISKVFHYELLKPDSTRN
jgi:4-oxalocrotonate tautomerase